MVTYVFMNAWALVYALVLNANTWTHIVCMGTYV